VCVIRTNNRTKFHRIAPVCCHGNYRYDTRWYCYDVIIVTWFRILFSYLSTGHWSCWTITNGFILYALVASKQHKKHVLVVRQKALDSFTSFCMIVTYSVKLCILPYRSCRLLAVHTATYWEFGLMETSASVIHPVLITIERHLWVVHHVCSQNKLRNWMVYSAIIVSYMLSFAVAFSSTAVMGGVCYVFAFMENIARIVNFALSCVLLYS